METFFFWVFAIAAIGGALSTVLRRNPLNSALSLVTTFIALSGLYFLQDAPFVGVLQVLVYAGAIMVLVVFVIMFLNLPDAQLEDEKLSKPGILIALFLLMPLATLCFGVMGGTELDPKPEKSETYGTMAAVGELLFDKYLFEFEIVSILLLVAIVGSVMLAKKRL